MAAKNKSGNANNEYAQELIDILKARPKLATVYINDNGEWLFSPREGFTAVKTAEILKPTSNNVE